MVFFFISIMSIECVSIQCSAHCSLLNVYVFGLELPVLLEKNIAYVWKGVNVLLSQPYVSEHHVDASKRKRYSFFLLVVIVIENGPFIAHLSCFKILIMMLLI